MVWAVWAEAEALSQTSITPVAQRIRWKFMPNIIGRKFEFFTFAALSGLRVW